MNPKTAQHTPTPWTSDPTKIGGNEFHVFGPEVTKDMPNLIAVTFSPYDAAFIVRTVNSYARRETALKEAYKLFGELRKNMDDDHWFAGDLDRIGSVISGALTEAQS